MKNRLVNFIILIIIPLIVCTLTGCETLNVSGIEIGKSNFIRAVGIDKAADGNGNVRLTTVSKKKIPMEGSTPKSGEEASIVMNSEGKTVFEAVRNFHTFSYQDVFWGHNGFIIISEELAREDIMKYLDFFTRDHELRLNAKVIIVKGTTAETFIKNGNTTSMFFPDVLNAVLSETDGISISKSIELSTAIAMFENGIASAYLPCAELIDAEKKPQGDLNKKDIILNGFALFKNNQLSEFATYGAGRGVNWIINNVKSGIIVVKDKTGGDVSLEIINSSRKIKPVLKNGVLNITVEIEETSNLDEQNSGEELFVQDTLKYLEERQNEAILKEAQSAIYLAQQYGLDPFGISNAVYHKYPIEWGKMKNNWEDIYKGTEIVVKVKSHIARAYLFNNPIRSSKKK